MLWQSIIFFLTEINVIVYKNK
ncbi:hypothetical protein DESC_720009 [Desulfosarcina cetonica]|nr:hypothetical protein DESC_720009 [Desulfosarcina cetonica]